MLDLKFINKFFTANKVKFENLSVLRYAPKECNFAISIDISDAYHHLKLHDDLVPYF